ncbi:type VI secretion system protein TssA [Thalassococcus sp. S3]|uniref:type VI secretion system protein TssA n=1 Tax=Thalassococcus sp. S3 TaxID=2017482 RepID=UPI0010244CA9|nr:type VI secretion system protein TssA [Thalassococcus sp. S3]QBF33994.1 hypothetical protein CFI11_22700 [Thalassococcus sp. S3]
MALDKISVAPIEDDPPCGEPLDYDLEFLDLEIMARGKPGQQTDGASVPGEPPDWASVLSLAEKLAARSHDIRLELLLSRAALQLEGLEGFAAALSRMASLVDTFWTDIHPCPEDDETDETIRINALSEVVDPDGLLGALRDHILVDSQRFGRFSIRDWNTARHDEDAHEDLQRIEGAFAEGPTENNDLTAGHLAECEDALNRLETAVLNHVSSHEAPDFAPIYTVLSQMRALVTPYCSEVPETSEPASDGGAEEGQTGGSAGRGRREIQNRDDIVETIDRICRWYRLNEPASPIPLLLNRARNLVSKDFMALMEELAPDGAPQFRHLAGIQNSPGEEQESA